MTAWTTLFPTKIGPLRMVVDERGRLTELTFHGRESGVEAEVSDRKCAHVTRQLREYFARKRQVFDLELAYQGTEFQVSVWDELTRIPYGTTISYRELASRIGRPKAVRAVGGANGRNPISIVVPCHRVIGASGELTGFGGGIPTKRALLELERALASPGLFDG